MPDEAPVLVVGAGAVGLFLAARLSRVAAVQLVARGPRARSLADGGFALDGAEKGHWRLPVLDAAATGWTVPPGALVVVAVKATQLAPVLEDLARRGAAGATVVLAQNGLGIVDLAKQLVPGADLVRLTCWFGVALDDVCRVAVAGGNAVEVAAEPAEAAEPIERLLIGAGFQAVPVATVAACEWRKALGNLASNGVCTLVGAPNGALLDDPDLHAVADGLLAEALKVASAEGVELADADVARSYEGLGRTRANRNSTLVDIERGRATEVEFLFGEVARRADRRGVAAPLNGAIAHLLRALERQAGSPADP